MGLKGHMAVVIALLVLPAAVAPATAAAPAVETVAGRSPAGYSGDGGPATEAQMNEPRMVSFDADGNTWVADTFNQLIRRIDARGVISTVVGKFTGFVPRDEAKCVPNFNGDDRPAREATLSCPHSVAVAGDGTIYVADSANHAVRKVDAAGVITAVAGQGGKAGDTGDGGPGTGARLRGPKDVVIDADGNLLIADSGNHRIRKLDMSSGVITTMAGTGRASSGGDGGPATEAALHEPRTLAVAPDGALIIAEPKAHRVRRVDRAGTITTVAGTGRSGFSGDGGPAVEARLDMPRGVAVDGAGKIFIADSLNQRVRMVDRSGRISTVAGRGTSCYFSSRNDCGDGGPPEEAGFATPRAVEVNGRGDLYITDTFNERVRRIAGMAAARR